MKYFFLIFLILTFAGPITLYISGHIDLKADYRTANRESSKIAPDALKTTEAVVQVYAARAFNWRGMFAVHTWIATKNKNAKEYMVYEKIGWRFFYKLPPVVVVPSIPDRLWFNQTPIVLIDIRGKKAEKIIEKLGKAIASYPYTNEYSHWPGPNSNTFTAYIGREIPELQLALPSNAIGKDYLGTQKFFASAPSHTGYQFSLFGVFGVLIAKKEGLEINILGLVYGINLLTATIKLPGFGDIKFF